MTALPHDKVADLGVVLGVWAHPDDEAYLSAGLMALVAETSGRVACVTATRGERGTDQPDVWPPERLAPVREREMAESLAILGVDEHHWLGHGDGECDTVAEEDGIAQVAAIIEAMRPDTVVTFGPDGMTGHSDHITVGRWATVAAHEADHNPRVLHASTEDALMADDALNDIGRVLDRLGVYGPQGPPRVSRHDAAVVLDLPERTLDQKIAALRAQASQTGPIIEELGEAHYRRWISVEVFVEALPTA